MKPIFIILTIFLLTLSFVSAETATYNSTFGAPLCVNTTGECVGTIAKAGTRELNTPNTIDGCSNEDTNSKYAYIGNLTASYSTLYPGSVVTISFSGECYVDTEMRQSIHYTLNPEAGTPTWVLIAYDTDNGKTNCNATDYTSSSSGLSTKQFTIPSNFTGDYVAIRYVMGDGTDMSSSACQSNTNTRDTDDLVLTMGVPLTIPVLAFVDANNITTTSVNLTGSFDLEDYSWGDAYFEINGVNTTKTNYTSNDDHTQVVTGLTSNTTYSYTFYVDYADGTINSAEYSCNSRFSFS